MKQLDVLWDLMWSAPHRLMRRGKQRRHQLTAGILILALVAQFGCASSGSVKRSALDLLPPPPGEAVHRVAVTSGRFAPTFDIIGSRNAPPSFKLQLLLVAIGPLVILFLLPALLLDDISKAIESKESVNERAITWAKRVATLNERETTAREMVAAQKIQDDLRDRMVAIGLAKTPHAFTGLADQGPSTPGEQPDYSSLSQEGIQSVLEVVVESVTLDGIDDIPDREFRLVMTINTRLIRTVDNAEIYANTRTYYGKSWQTMEEWVGDPEGFRDELNRVYAEITERTVEEIFPRTESN
jgi:hypothetical protein